MGPFSTFSSFQLTHCNSPSYCPHPFLQVQLPLPQRIHVHPFPPDKSLSPRLTKKSEQPTLPDCWNFLHNLHVSVRTENHSTQFQAPSSLRFANPRQSACPLSLSQIQCFLEGYTIPLGTVSIGGNFQIMYTPCYYCRSKLPQIQWLEQYRFIILPSGDQKSITGLK